MTKNFFSFMVMLWLIWMTTHSIAQDALDRETREDIARAVVQIRNIDGSVLLIQTGILISPSGFILTTQGDIAASGASEFSISTFNGINTPPSSRYRASVTFSSPELDLAILQIVSDAQGNSILSDQLQVDYIFRWGRDAETSSGESVYVVAYTEDGELIFDPGTVVSSAENEDTVTEGFIDSDFVDDATRGGIVINAEGEAIGIVTALESGRASANFTRFIPVNVLCTVHQRICDNLFVTTPPAARSTLRAVVCLANGVGLDVRESPASNSRSLERVSLGDHVTLLDSSSVVADGVSWVQLQTIDGNRGWIPDIFNQSRTLLSYQYSPQIEQTYPITAGNQAVACAVFPNEEIRLRSNPDGSITKRLRSGVFVTVVSGPIVRSSGEWWQVLDTEGISGWIVEFDGETRSLIGLPR